MSKFKIAKQHYQDPWQAPDPAQYQASEGLRRAITVAIRLQQPLLLTGEPGTGKTQLAHALAYDLHQQDPENFYPRPLVFNTKSTSLSSDLFYTYDALKHFYEANIQKIEGKPAPEVADYIQLQALGKAIALSSTKEVQAPKFLKKEDIPDGKAKSSVVLIDEIDKAPRDFPNDILNEIETKHFQIKEADNYTIESDQQSVIMILTSNSEKSLPDAFLRRVVFYHIPFPEKKQLAEIVLSQIKSQIDDGEQGLEAYLSYLIDKFMEIRQALKRKKPATAELLAWIRMLNLEGFIRQRKDFDKLSAEDRETLQISYSVLAKNKEDLDVLIKKMKNLTQT